MKAAGSGRTRALNLLFYGGFIALMLRLIAVVALPDNSASRKDDNASPIKSTSIRAPRGRILDRNYRVLAVEEEVRRVILRPRLISDKKLVSRVVSKRLGIPQDKILHRLQTSDDTWVIAHEATVESCDGIRKDIAKEIAADYDARREKAKAARARLPFLRRLITPVRVAPGVKIRGVEYEERYRRVHPYGNLAAKLLGAVNSSGVGICGVELARQSELGGKAGTRVSLVPDASQAGYSRVLKTSVPVPGNDVVLTIDSRIQQAAEQALGEQVKKYKASSGSIIVLDPQTSEILALAEHPTFDPSRIGKLSDASVQFSSIRNVYEPGSTGKAFTALAGLRFGQENIAEVCTGKISLGSHVRPMNCQCLARRKYPGQPVTLARMLECSCNTLASRIARRIGDRKTYDEWKLLGMIAPMQIPGIGRTSGAVVPDPNAGKWNITRLAGVGFGQSIAVTRIQLANAYASIANGGKLFRPYLIREVREPDGRSLQRFSPQYLRRVAPAAHARKVVDWMVGTINNGTGKTAALDDFQVAGKTGSAQVPLPKGGYSEDVIASFCGIAPAHDPKAVILVTVEKPRGSTHGATVAAPAFKKVAERALLFLAGPSGGSGGLAVAPGGSSSKV